MYSMIFYLFLELKFFVDSEYFSRRSSFKGDEYVYSCVCFEVCFYSGNGIRFRCLLYYKGGFFLKCRGFVWFLVVVVFMLFLY